MFSSPAIRPISNENPADLVARKPNLNVPKSTRKPFGDRAVNDPTPIKNFNLKPRVQLNKTPVVVHSIEDKEDMINYDICSFKEPPDNFEDICPKNEQFTSEDLLNIFLPFCGFRNLPTPPYIRAESPKIEIKENPLNFPEIIDFPELKEEFDISVPEIDDSLSEFDKSF